MAKVNTTVEDWCAADDANALPTEGILREPPMREVAEAVPVRER